MTTAPVCDLCGSEGHNPVFNLGEFQILRCSSCGLVYRYPMPTDEQLFVMYNTPNEASTTEIIEYYKAFRQQTYRTMFRHLLQNVTLPRESWVVDVGTGYGWSYEVIREFGFNPLGVDLDLRDLRHAVLEGATVQAWSERLPFADGSLSALMLVDVLEHVREPRRVLHEMSRILAPRGVLIIRVPDTYSVLLRAIDLSNAMSFGRLRSIGGRLYRYHLFGFGLKTLSRYLHESGFRVVSSYRESSKNLDGLSNKSWAKNPVIRYGVVSLTRLGELTGREDELVVIAQRSSP